MGKVVPVETDHIHSFKSHQNNQIIPETTPDWLIEQPDSNNSCIFDKVLSVNTIVLVPVICILVFAIAAIWVVRM
jgi:hypothetical protein